MPEMTIEPIAAQEPPSAPPGATLDSLRLAAIYEEHARPIYYLALRFLGDPTQAEDATHDVFLFLISLQLTPINNRVTRILINK